MKLKLSNKEKAEKIDLYIQEIKSIFNIEEYNPDSPIYEFLNNRSYDNIVCDFGVELYDNILVVYYLHVRHRDIIKGESENVNRAIELADSIVDLLSIDKKDFRVIALGMIGIFDNTIPFSNNVHDENMRINTLIIIDELFRFIYPREKEYLFSDWIESFHALIKTIPKLNKSIYKPALKMFIEKLPLTDSDREASSLLL